MIEHKEGFGLTYRDKDNSIKTPLCIHRAPQVASQRYNQAQRASDS